MDVEKVRYVQMKRDPIWVISLKGATINSVLDAIESNPGLGLLDGQVSYYLGAIPDDAGGYSHLCLSNEWFSLDDARKSIQEHQGS